LAGTSISAVLRGKESKCGLYVDAITTLTPQCEGDLHLTGPVIRSRSIQLVNKRGI